MTFFVYFIILSLFGCSLLFNYLHYIHNSYRNSNYLLRGNITFSPTFKKTFYIIGYRRHDIQSIRATYPLIIDFTMFTQIKNQPTIIQPTYALYMNDRGFFDKCIINAREFELFLDNIPDNYFIIMDPTNILCWSKLPHNQEFNIHDLIGQQYDEKCMFVFTESILNAERILLHRKIIYMFSPSDNSVREYLRTGGFHRYKFIEHPTFHVPYWFQLVQI